MKTITPSEVEKMQRNGFTQEMATEWRDFYKNEFNKDSNNITAQNRFFLMENILKHIK